MHQVLQSNFESEGVEQRKRKNGARKRGKEGRGRRKNEGPKPVRERRKNEGPKPVRKICEDEYAHGQAVCLAGVC